MQLNKTVDAEIKTIDDAINSDKWKSYLEGAIKKYNDKPISNAQKIQKYV